MANDPVAKTLRGVYERMEPDTWHKWKDEDGKKKIGFTRVLVSNKQLVVLD